MNGLTFSPAATADINDIWDYTAENWGIDQADYYADDIRDACYALAANEIKGHIVSVRNGYLKYSSGKHYIFYKLEGDHIKIIRILHQSMDTERHLKT